MIFNFFKRNNQVNEVDDDEPEKDGIQVLVEMANRINPNWYEEAKAKDLAEDNEDRDFWVEFYSHEDDD